MSDGRGSLQGRFDLSRVDFPRRPLGYDRDMVDALIGRAASELQALRGRQIDLEERIAALEDELNQRRQKELQIGRALLTAQAIKAGAEQEAEARLEEAEREAEAVLHAIAERQAHHEQELDQLKSLEGEMRAGYRAFLLAALELLEGRTPPVEEPRPAIAEKPS